MSARYLLCLTSAVLLMASLAQAAPPKLDTGKVSLKSVGPMTFASGGILLVGDPMNATVYAIDTQDAPSGSGTQSIEDIGKAVASTLGGSDEVQVGELAVNPETGNAFLTVSAGDKIQIVKVDGENTITALNLDDIGHAKKVLPNPPPDREVRRGRRSRNARKSSITDLAFFDGKVMVTGVSADSSPSKVMEFEFPFSDNSVTTSVEIFHAAHGRVEDATIQTFLPIVIDGKPNLLAGFTCTPLVRFPVSQLGSEEKVRGTTVAELGNRNVPLDMIVYEKDGELSILMSNSARGMMKITTDGIGERESLGEKVNGGGTAGQPFETVESLANVRQMDKLDDSRALALVETDGALALKAIALP